MPLYYFIVDSFWAYCNIGFGVISITQIEKKNLELVILENYILDCWFNGEYMHFFVSYLQQHKYIKTKDIIKSYFNENKLPKELCEEYYRSFLARQVWYLNIASKFGYLEKYNTVTFKHTKKIQNPGPLIKELKKIRFKS
ncbi:MAG: hypothetical protein ACFFDF_23765 [Candidatus Odinarchaeota archaeon]